MGWVMPIPVSLVNRLFIVAPLFVLRYVSGMTKAAAIQAIRQRADQARIPMYKLCEAIKMSPATLTRWTADPEAARWSSIGRLEKHLDKLERARNTPALHVEVL